MAIDLTNKRIIISRTDSIGDVMLTLPICAWIKENFEGTHILFLGSGYTKPVVDCFEAIDEFIDWRDFENVPTTQRAILLKEKNADIIIHVFPKKEIATLAKQAKIPVRVGTSHRGFHLLTCNERVSFTRKRSELHEAQLNFKLLQPFGIKEIPTLEQLISYTVKFNPPEINLPEDLENKVKTAEKTIILHPKSQGSALEWPMEKYSQLAMELTEKGYHVFFTGTEKEGAVFRKDIPQSENITDTTGRLTLQQLILLISNVNSLVACSTGPLHIAGFTGIRAVGLFSSRKPIHPGRWQPLGKDVHILVNDPDCPECSRKKKCDCITNITVDRVLGEITA